MDKWSKPADRKSIRKAMDALRKNKFNVFLVETPEDAKKKFFEIVPEGASIINSSSKTLDSIGIAKEINESGKYDSVKNKLNSMDRKTQHRQMQQLGSAPEWAVGSVHAITKDGHVLIASRSGSQIPGYAYGADHVIWVAGIQKIVENINEGIKRIFEYCLVLESKRVQKAYGMEKSTVSKILIFNEEINPDRTTIILINQAIGF
ncbi:MAG: LUD domain-containing protein [Candidatus Levybacteria bacterium]|nr:LUD domain-containing protein [Candidatus Levybacteria bacterium]